MTVSYTHLPKLIISTYSDYFKKFEKIYGDKLKTYSGAWPDWWVNYHGAVSFETGVNRITHTAVSYTHLPDEALTSAI